MFPLLPLFAYPSRMNTPHPESAAIIAYGIGLIAVAAAFQFVDGLQAIALAVLRGLKDTRVPMICAVFSYWVVGIPTSYLLGFKLGFGGYGVWLGLVIGLFLASFTLVWRYVMIRRRLGSQMGIRAWI